MPFLFAIIGAVLRRWWGGWFQPNNILKKLVGFIIPFMIVLFYTDNAYAALWVAACIEGLWLNTFNSNGFSMGREYKSLRYCVAIMGGSNGAYTTLAAAGLAGFTGNYLFGLYALAGFLVPAGYMFGWWIYEHALGFMPDGTPIGYGYWGKQPNVLIDGPTSIGELFLGGFVLGGLSLALTFA